MFLHSLVTRASLNSTRSHQFHKMVIILPTECWTETAISKPKRTARKQVTANGRSISTVEVDEEALLHEDEMLGEDWRRFCKTEVPVLVRNQMRTIKELGREFGEELEFGGPRGSLRGRSGAVEDHRHRAVFETLSDSEEKMQNFAARQVACRVLGSTGYACENCWLPLRDCMCSSLLRGVLWPGVRIWLYTHPKDFLRKNNTGKLLWQIFGSSAATCVVCGIQEQEDAMWAVFKQAGRDRVWCVYPEKTAPETRVVDLPMTKGGEMTGACIMHFVLIDGTWGNSKSMVSRLKDRARVLWGEGLACVTLSPISVSVMHGLRPQPSMERTCTAAAAGQLLEELSMRSELAEQGLDHSAELVDAALSSLQDALVTRRGRDGRPTSRVGRAYSQAAYTSD